MASSVRKIFQTMQNTFAHILGAKVYEGYSKLAFVDEELLMTVFVN